MTRPATPLPWLLLLLSVTTGLVDAISVLGLGKVFTANMTGNIVFLGFAAVGTPGFAPLSYVVAILAFMTGALVAGRVGKGHEGRPMRRWLLIAALVEAGLLWIAAAVAIGFDPASPSPDRNSSRHSTVHRNHCPAKSATKHRARPLHRGPCPHTAVNATRCGYRAPSNQLPLDDLQPMRHPLRARRLGRDRCEPTYQELELRM